MSKAKQISEYIAANLGGYYTRSAHAAKLVAFWKSCKKHYWGKDCPFIVRGWPVSEIVKRKGG